MINAVLDTNVIVSGLLSAHGNPATIVNAFKERHINLFYSVEIVSEYRDVLSRDKFGLNIEDINDLFDEIKKAGFPVIPCKSSISLTDEDDRIFYDTAKAVDAYLVTGNTKHFPNDPRIVTPADFVALIQSTNHL